MQRASCVPHYIESFIVEKAQKEKSSLYKHISPEFLYSTVFVCQGSRWLAMDNQHLSLLAHRTLAVMVDKH